jgi:hypothetical protein
MNERELLIDCLRRLNRADVSYYLTGLRVSSELERLLRGEIKPKQT